MHVHASYSINLAEMGSNRDEIHEIAARRAAEVRRRLAALALTSAHDDDVVALVKAVAASSSDLPVDAYSATEEQTILTDQGIGRVSHVPSTQGDPSDAQSLFSALA